MRTWLRNLLSFSLLMTLSLYLLLLDYHHKMRTTRYSTQAGEVALAVFMPVFRLTQSALSQAKLLYERLNSNQELWQEREKLTEELVALKTALKLAEEKNQQLMRLIQLTSDTLTVAPSQRIIPAEIIAFNITPLTGNIIINKGEKDGVNINSTVAYGESLVGFVAATARDSAVVQLLVDPHTVVSGIIEPSRELCLVKSMGTKKNLQLTTERSTLKLTPRSRVLTSGINTSIYPKGLVIGKITSVNKNLRGEIVAEVKPEIDFSRLEEVLLIPQNTEKNKTVIIR